MLNCNMFLIASIRLADVKLDYIDLILGLFSKIWLNNIIIRIII